MSAQEVCRLNGKLGIGSPLVVGQRLIIVPQHTAISVGSASSEPQIVVQTQEPNNFEEAVAASAREGGGSQAGSTGGEWDRLNEETVAPHEMAPSTYVERGNIGVSEGEGLRKPRSAINNSAEGVEGNQTESLSYSAPKSKYIWPVKGKILRRFHEKLQNGTLSEGINIAAPLGVNVKACRAGTVLEAGELVLGFGKMVILSHEDDTISIYGHLQDITVKRPLQGELVKIQQGQVIGKVGKTGNVRTPQLHFQLRNAKKDPVDPLMFLPEE
jgi:murein DD-endopeptidase MepM/ murein hydrolase activator NlpD